MQHWLHFDWQFTRIKRQMRADNEIHSPPFNFDTRNQHSLLICKIDLTFKYFNLGKQPIFVYKKFFIYCKKLIKNKWRF